MGQVQIQHTPQSIDLAHLYHIPMSQFSICSSTNSAQQVLIPAMFFNQHFCEILFLSNIKGFCAGTKSCNY